MLCQAKFIPESLTNTGWRLKPRLMGLRATKLPCGG